MRKNYKWDGQVLRQSKNIKAIIQLLVGWIVLLISNPKTVNMIIYFIFFYYLVYCCFI